MPSQEGQFLVEHFYLNTGGLNTADSPFVIDKDSSTGGQNYDRLKRGGIQKRAGHLTLNTAADTQLQSLGLHLWNKPGSSRKVIRTAGKKIQNFDVNAFTFTNLSEDTASAGTDFLAASTTIPTVASMFNSATAGTLFLAGGGLTTPYGVYSATKVTKNGADAPVWSAFTGTPGGSGNTLTAGAYYYTLVLRKASTQALSNAGLDSAQITVTSGQKVDLAWTLTGLDTTKYDKIYVYRSSVNGATPFTAGALIAQVASTATSYSDTGTVVLDSQNVPRASNLVLDNSTLPAGSYNCITTFKQRLVTASGSGFYLSAIGAPESWPISNRFTVPSGGDITGLAILSLSSGLGADIDEVLCIFKQNELWVLTGNSVDDWVLKQVDNSGCAGQPLVVSANGYLAWVSYRGIFIWNGAGKPTYLSQPIEDKFGIGGDIDKSKLSIGVGTYFQSRSEIEWYLSSTTSGTQKYTIKLDLRLTMERLANMYGQAMLKGVFSPDVTAFPVYAALTFLDSGSATEEQLFLGDGAGFIYTGYKGQSDGGNDITFTYPTAFLNMNTPNTAKRFNKVVVWVLDTGPYNLELDYWADYRVLSGDQSALTQPASAQLVQTGAVWNAFVWGAANWGAVANKVRALTFNLNSSRNNGEGDALRLQFTQTGNAQTVVIYGFSVYYTELSLRK